MRCAYFSRVTNLLINNSRSLSAHIKFMTDTIPMNGLRRSGYARNSPKKVEFFESHGDDFIQNMTTIRISFNAIKAPRIVLKNKRHNRSMMKILNRIK